MSKQNNKNNTIIRTNRMAAVLALIIVIMCSFNLKDILEYEDIVIDRRSVANSVSNGSLSLEKFAEDYQVCIERMGELRDASQLGEFMADNDEKPVGQIVNYLLVAGAKGGMFFLCAFILVNVVLEMMLVLRKVKRSYRRAKKQREHEKKRQEAQKKQTEVK